MSFDRDAALHQAMLAFWRDGYASTSISTLTAAMGVTAPSIYAAFGNKKQLFLEAMHRYAGSLEEFEIVLAQAPTARQAAQGMLSSAVERFTGENTPHGCLLSSATANGSLETAHIRREIAEVRRGVELLLRKRIEQDVSCGALPEETNAMALAGMIVTLIQGLSLQARDGAKRDTLNAIISTAMRSWPPHYGRGQGYDNGA